MADGSADGIGANLGAIDTGLTAMQLAAGCSLEHGQRQVYLQYTNIIARQPHYGVVAADFLTMSVVNQVKLDDEPTDMVLTPDGQFLYLAAGEGLILIDTGVFETIEIPLVVPPGAVAAHPLLTFPMNLLTGVALTPDGAHLLVAGQQQPHSQETNSYLALVEAGTFTVLKAITAGSTDFQQHHVVVTPDGRYAVVNLALQSIVVVDLASFAIVTTIGVSPWVLDLAVAGTRLYVATGLAGGSSGSVVVVDLTTLATVGEPFPLPAAPIQLQVSRSGTRLFVACNNQTLVVLDAQSGTNLGALPSAGPFATDADGQRINVFDSNSQILNVFGLTG